MDNFIKYYSYFVSEYVVKALYDDFAPDDNMVSSGANMLSYIAELGSNGKIVHGSVEDLYTAIRRVVRALFSNSEQYFITKDRTIIKIDGLDFDDIVKINDLIVSGVDSKDLLHKLDSGDLWFKFEVVSADDINGVGSRCFQNIYFDSNFVGAIPQVHSFIEQARSNLTGGYSILNTVEESFVEEDVYSALDFV